MSKKQHRRNPGGRTTIEELEVTLYYNLDCIKRTNVRDQSRELKYFKMWFQQKHLLRKIEQLKPRGMRNTKIYSNTRSNHK